MADPLSRQSRNGPETTLKSALKRRLPLPLLGALAASKVEWKSGARKKAKRQHRKSRARLSRLGNQEIGLAEFEYRILSQNGEDGIIDAIFQLIGHQSGKVIEFGFAPTEANCLNQVLSCRLNALFMDASPIVCNIARAMFGAMGFPSIKSVPCLITTDNVNRVFFEQGFSGEMDILSIDIDGNDYWIWKAIDVISPRLVVVEYNDRLGPEAAVTISYDPHFACGGDPETFYEGASLAALHKLGRSKGYDLVGCDSAGVNAFFLRQDARHHALPARAVAEAFRYHARSIARGLSATERSEMIASRSFVHV